MYRSIQSLYVYVCVCVKEYYTCNMRMDESTHYTVRGKKGKILLRSIIWLICEYVSVCLLIIWRWHKKLKKFSRWNLNFLCNFWWCFSCLCFALYMYEMNMFSTIVCMGRMLIAIMIWFIVLTTYILVCSICEYGSCGLWIWTF